MAGHRADAAGAVRSSPKRAFSFFSWRRRSVLQHRAGGLRTRAKPAFRERRMTSSVRVVKPGLLTTVQDLGRWGWQSRGVPVAGPMDPFSHRRANALVGNPPN